MEHSLAPVLCWIDLPGRLIFEISRMRPFPKFSGVLRGETEDSEEFNGSVERKGALSSPSPTGTLFLWILIHLGPFLAHQRSLYLP